MDVLVPVVAILGTIFGGTGLLVWWSVRQQRRRRQETLERIAKELGVKSIGMVSVGTMPKPVPGFEYQGDGGHFKVFPFQRGKYEFIEIQLVTEATLPLAVFRKERRLDRIGRTLLLNREVQLDDQEFDDQVYIESDELDAHVRAALGDRRVRDSVLRAVRLGHAVTFSRHGVSMVLPISAAVPASEQIRRNIALLREFAVGLRSVAGAVGVRQGARGDQLVLAGCLLLVGTYLFSAIASIARPSLWEPLHQVGQKLPKQIAGASLLLFAVAGFVYMRGHSRSLRNYAAFILPMFLYMPFLPSAILWSANAALDRAPLSFAGGTVRDKIVKRGSKTSTYRLKLALDGDRPAPQYLSFKSISILVPYGTYKALAVGDRVQVSVHQGAFGWPWVGTVSRIGGPPAPPAAPGAPAPASPAR